ncbi:mitochondrial 28s ribosomal s29-like partial [Nannochloropsis oceanica]
MKRLLCGGGGGSGNRRLMLLASSPSSTSRPAAAAMAATRRSLRITSVAGGSSPPSSFSSWPSSLVLVPHSSFSTKSINGGDGGKPPRSGRKAKGSNSSSSRAPASLPYASDKEPRDPIKITLPPGMKTEGMTVEEITASADAYELQQKGKATSSSSSSSSGKLDLSYVYAPSNDPRTHADAGGAAAVGKVYTLNEEEVGRFFPGPWSKPGRVPWEAGLQSLLASKFLLVRPQAIEVIEHLKAFAARGGRGWVDGMEGAEKLREEWVRGGGLAAAMARGKDIEVSPQQQQQQQQKEKAERNVAPAGRVGEEEGEEEEEEEEDDYDLFGEEEDEEEQERKEKKAAGGLGEGVYEGRKTDWDMYGTLKRLAVDDVTLEHPEQTLELPLTEAPTEDGKEGGRSIFLLSGPRGSGKTASLYHTVHYARKSGWLVFFIPSAYEYLHEGGLVRPSPFFKGYFDTPDLAQTTLRQLGEAHGHQLAGLPLKDREVVERLGLKEGGREGGRARGGDFAGFGGHHKHIAFLAARTGRYPRLSRAKAKKGQEGRKRLADLPPHPLPPSLPAYDILHPPSYSPSEFQALYHFVADQGLWGSSPTLDDSSIRQARVATAAHPLTFARDAAAIDRRLFSPQNKVGKASAHAPANFMLVDLLEEGGGGGEEGGRKDGGGGGTRRQQQQQQRA